MSGGDNSQLLCTSEEQPSCQSRKLR